MKKDSKLHALSCIAWKDKNNLSHSLSGSYLSPGAHSLSLEFRVTTLEISWHQDSEIYAVYKCKRHHIMQLCTHCKFKLFACVFLIL